MTQISHQDNQSFLKSVGRRAHRLLVAAGLTPATPQKRKYTRSELRQLERIAQRALDESKHGACAQLARDMVDIAVSVDNHWVEIYPVFDMIDKAVKHEHCRLEVSGKGYKLLDVNNDVVSQGETLRLWLLNHVSLYSYPVTEVYNRSHE